MASLLPKPSDVFVVQQSKRWNSEFYDSYLPIEGYPVKPFDNSEWRKLLSEQDKATDRELYFIQQRLLDSFRPLACLASHLEQVLPNDEHWGVFISDTSTMINSAGAYITQLRKLNTFGSKVDPNTAKLIVKQPKGQPLIGEAERKCIAEVSKTNRDINSLKNFSKGFGKRKQQGRPDRQFKSNYNQQNKNNYNKGRGGYNKGRGRGRGNSRGRGTRGGKASEPATQ